MVCLDHDGNGAVLVRGARAALATVKRRDSNGLAASVQRFRGLWPRLPDAAGKQKFSVNVAHFRRR